MVKQLLLKTHFTKKTASFNNEIEINRIVLFDKASYGNKGSFKHYIGYKYTDGNLSPLNTKLPQLTGYARI